jgi:hypothetical protein
VWLCRVPIGEGLYADCCYAGCCYPDCCSVILAVSFQKTSSVLDEFKIVILQFIVNRKRLNKSFIAIATGTVVERLLHLLKVKGSTLIIAISQCVCPGKALPG